MHTGRWDYPVAYRRVGDDISVYFGKHPTKLEFNGGIEWRF